MPRRILQKRAMTIPARYENGVFRPLQDVAIKEGRVVEVHLHAEARHETAIHWRFALCRHVEGS